MPVQISEKVPQPSWVFRNRHKIGKQHLLSACTTYQLWCRHFNMHDVISFPHITQSGGIIPVFMPEGKSQGSKRFNSFAKVPQLMHGGLSDPVVIWKLCSFWDSSTPPDGVGAGGGKGTHGRRRNRPLLTAQGDICVRPSRRPGRFLVEPAAWGY